MHRALRPLVLARDGYRCQDCGSTEDLQAGHIDRLGPDVLENYRAQCRPCNLAQASREARGEPPQQQPEPHPGYR